MSMNIYRLMLRVLKSNFVDLKYPYRLNFILTYKCNERCAMCDIWRKETKNEITVKDIDRFFSKNNHFSWVDVSGGEIFLRKDILDIVEIIISRCRCLYLLHFPTNGLMTDKIVSVTKDILSHFKQKLIITISLDGPSELHDRIRGVKGSWQRTIDTYRQLEKIKAANLELYFGMTISDLNIQAYMDTYRAAKRLIPHLQHDDMHLNFIHNSEHYYDYSNAHIIGEERYLRTLEEIISTRTKSIYPVHLLEHDYLRFMRKYLKTGRSPLLCEALSSSCFIDPNADVYVCSIWNKKIGNLRDTDFDLGKIMHSEAARRLRSQIKQGKCPHCWTPCEAYTGIMAHKLPFSK